LHIEVYHSLINKRKKEGKQATHSNINKDFQRQKREGKTRMKIGYFIKEKENQNGNAKLHQHSEGKL
jgi:hypothetical protein